MEFVRRAGLATVMPMSFYFGRAVREGLILLENFTEEIFPMKNFRCGYFAKLVFFDQRSTQKAAEFARKHLRKFEPRSNVATNVNRR